MPPARSLDATNPVENELAALLREAGVEFGLTPALARYGALVLEANRRFNVTGAKLPHEVVGHILDALTVVPFVRAPYVDIGSGGGFPAIPVAIATGTPVTMIESTAKKARFLASVLERLELQGEVRNERAEAAGHDPALRERFASGTARAVGSAPMVAELLLPLIEPGGVAVLQRGGQEPGERTALDDASLVLGGFVEAAVPLEAGRAILLVRKREATPIRFPRRSGIPAKRPLCSEGA